MILPPGGVTVLTAVDPTPPPLAPAEAVTVGTEEERAGIRGRSQVGVPYEIAGKWYTPAEDPDYDETGMASWYGSDFHGRLTANGEIFDRTGITAAHPTLPLPSYVRVTNLDNDRSIVVRVNDRGPYAHKRLIDVSEQTAELLDFRHDGMTSVRVQYMSLAPLDREDTATLLATYEGPAVAADASVMLASAEQPQSSPPAVTAEPEDAPVALVSAEREIPAPKAATVAHKEVAPPEPPAPRPVVTAVAFAAPETAPGDGAVAIANLSDGISAESRILMAFELVDQIEE